MSKKVFYIGNNTDFWTSLYATLMTLQYKNVKQYEDENMGSVACITEQPDVVIFDCESENALQHAQDVFSYPQSKNKVFFRGPLAPLHDGLYKPFCLAVSYNESEDIAIHENNTKMLQQLGLL